MKKLKILIFLLLIFVFLPFVNVKAWNAYQCSQTSDFDCVKIKTITGTTLSTTKITAVEGSMPSSSEYIENTKAVYWVYDNNKRELANTTGNYEGMFLCKPKKWISEINKIQHDNYKSDYLPCLYYSESSNSSYHKAMYQCAYINEYNSRSIATMLLCLSDKKKEGEACSKDDDCQRGAKCIDGKCFTENKTSTDNVNLNAKVEDGTCKVDCKIGGFFKNTRKECICCGLCTPDDLMTVANTILAWLFGIVGALGLAMFVYGGFLWVISRGDSGSIGKGKDVIKNTVIGMVIMFASGTMIMALQTALNVDKSAQVEITGKTQFGGSSGGASDDASDAEHGDKNVGDACKTLDGEDSECKSGAYCYSASKTKGSSGVCVPITKNRGDVKEGGECFYMPHTDTPSMCAEGQCVTGKSNPVVGDKGECKKTGADSSTNLPIGSQCTRLAGSASQCESGAECWNASGKINSSGKCLPESGRNKDYGEDCYLLQGANDCKSPYYCIVSGMLSGWSLGNSKTAFRGDPGTCLYQYHSRSDGDSCKENFECSSGSCSSGTCE